MKTTTSILWSLLFSLVFFSCKKTTLSETMPPPAPGEDANLIAETYPAVQTPVTFPVNNDVGGYYEALPALYPYSTKNYPLLINIHDVNALGNGSTDLPKVLARAIPRLLHQKKFPAAFLAGGKEHSFVIISPQFRLQPSPKDVNTLIDYIIKKYRIDTTRIYIVGHSSGGAVAWEYSVMYGGRIAAVVPISGANGYVNDVRGAKIASFNLPIWAFHNDHDPTVPSTTTSDFIALINSHGPSPAASVTLLPSSAHDAWTKVVDPAFKNAGKNIYEWMLQYSR